MTQSHLKFIFDLNQNISLDIFQSDLYLKIQIYIPNKEIKSKEIKILKPMPYFTPNMRDDHF